LDPGIIATLLVGLAGPLIESAERAGVARLAETAPVQRAAKRTGDAFPEVEECSETLIQWADEDSFHELLDRFRKGERDLGSDERIAQAFVESSRFDFGEETSSKAIEVVIEFLRNLKAELYSSEEGVSLLAERAEVIHEEDRSAFLGLSDMVADIQSTVGRIAASPQLGEPQAPSIPAEVPIIARLDAARDLLRRGRSRPALELLSDIEVDPATANTSPETRYRLAMNQGSGNLDLGRPDVALEHYARALELRPGDPAALSMEAKSHLMADRLDQALPLAERAAQADPSSQNAVGLKLLILHRLGRPAEVEAVLQEAPWFAESPLGAGMLGELRLAQGRFGEAVPLLRRGLTSEDIKLPYARMLLAVALVNLVRAEEGLDEGAKSQVGAESDALLREAEETFTRALDGMSELEERETYLDTLASRAGVRAMLGDLTEALADCDRVLAEVPTNGLALGNKARILFLLNRNDEALAVIESQAGPGDIDALILKAAIELRLGRPNDAMRVAVELWNEDQTDRLQLELADIILGAEAETGATDWTPRVLLRLETQWPMHPVALIMRAEAAVRAGEPAEGIPLVTQALQLPGLSAKRVGYFLAFLHFNTGQFAEAVSAYETAGIPDPGDPEFRNYLVTLLRAGRMGRVLEELRAARQERRSAIPSVSDLEAQILDFIGDLAGADAILTALVSLLPDDIALRLHQLSVRLRMGDQPGALHVLDSIPVDRLSDDPEWLMSVAEARQILDQPGVLELAYQARQTGFDLPMIHRRYLGIILNQERATKDDLLDLPEVSVDATVHLKRDGEEVVVTILKGEEGASRTGDIGVEDDLAKRLLGHRVGDRISVGPEGPGSIEYEIGKIQSKYVYAFQQTMLKFPVWFPDEPDFARVEVSENDVSKLLLILDERHQFAEQVMDLYRTGRVTIGVIAELLGRSIVDVWAGLVGIVGQRLLASAGDEQEVARFRESLASASSLTLDVVSVLTLAHLGLLDRILGMFDHVFAAQSVIDHIRLHYLRNFTGATPSGTMGKQGGQYFLTEVNPGDLKRGRAFMESILEFLEQKVETAPLTAALEFQLAEYEKLRGVIGAASADAIFVAKGTDSLLLSDDLRLRQLAQSEFGVDGISVEALLRELEARDVLSREDRREAVIALILSNYRYPRVSAEDLFRHLEREGFELTGAVDVLLHAALGADYDTESVVGVAAALIRDVWRAGLLVQRREALTALVIGSVVQPRTGRREILTRLAKRLEVMFRLDPLNWDQLAALINSWAAAHYL